MFSSPPRDRFDVAPCETRTDARVRLSTGDSAPLIPRVLWRCPAAPLPPPTWSSLTTMTSPYAISRLDERSTSLPWAYRCGYHASRHLGVLWNAVRDGLLDPAPLCRRGSECRSVETGPAIRDRLLLCRRVISSASCRGEIARTSRSGACDDDPSVSRDHGLRRDVALVHAHSSPNSPPAVATRSMGDGPAATAPVSPGVRGVPWLPAALPTGRAKPPV